MAANELLQGLMKDIAEAKETVGRSEMGQTGEKERTKTEFAPKALRIKGRTLAKNELLRNQRLFDRTVEQIVQASRRFSGAQKASKSMELKNRFNRLQLETIKQAVNLDNQLAQQRADERERAAALSLFTQTVSSGIAAGLQFNPSKEEGELVDFDKDSIKSFV